MYFLKPNLGKLEIQILEIFWKDPKDWDVKGMHAEVFTDHNVSLNTVQSTMERLFRKGFLGREKVSHAYLYSCLKSREDFVGETMQVFMQEMNVDESTFFSAFLNASSKKAENNLDDLVSKLRTTWNRFRGQN